MTDTATTVPALCILIGALGACAAQPVVDLTALTGLGENGRGRLELVGRINRQGPRSGRNVDRSYVLDRIGLAILTLADGYGHWGGRIFEDLYEVLRRQGLNRDRTVTAMLINEDLKIWKGEPFEQAMAFHYIAVHYAQQGDWANARAAADNSLFYLRDFGRNCQGQRKSPEDLIQQAQRDGQDVGHGYVAVASDFALGYLMHGIASMRLQRPDEALDHLHYAVRLDGALGPVVDQIEQDQCNVVLVVDFGRGPQKVATGIDQAVARFVPRMMSEPNQKLLVRTSNGGFWSFPVACDLNRMAVDHMWNNLEDLRLAKSHIGSTLVGAGAVMTGFGLGSDRKSAALVGLGLVGSGALAKAGAHADTRYCSLMPQRVYVAPITVESARTTISVEVQDAAVSKMVLTGIDTAGGAVQMRYVRLVLAGARAPDWAVSGQVHYANESTPGQPQPTLPYILGGNCVRPPSRQVLAAYQQAGRLQDWTLQDLLGLYELEGIFTNRGPSSAQPGRHLLEGGDSLLAPQAGTSGFARLFGRVHDPYVPKNDHVREVARSLDLDPGPVAAPP